MSKRPSSNRSQCQLFYIHMVIQGRDYPREYNYFKITYDCLFSHALGRCYEHQYKSDADLKNLFWHYEQGLLPTATCSYFPYLTAFEQLCCRTDTVHLLEKLSLHFSTVFIALYFVLAPFHLSTLISPPLFLCILLFTLKYGICSIWLFLDVSCSPAIYSVLLPILDVLQSFTHELHKPDLGIFLSHLSARSAL